MPWADGPTIHWSTVLQCSGILILKWRIQCLAHSLEDSSYEQNCDRSNRPRRNLDQLILSIRPTAIAASVSQRAKGISCLPKGCLGRSLLPMAFLRISFGSCSVISHLRGCQWRSTRFRSGLRCADERLLLATRPDGKTLRAPLSRTSPRRVMSLMARFGRHRVHARPALPHKGGPER